MGVLFMADKATALRFVKHSITGVVRSKGVRSPARSNASTACLVLAFDLCNAIGTG